MNAEYKLTVDALRIFMDYLDFGARGERSKQISWLENIPVKIEGILSNKALNEGFRRALQAYSNTSCELLEAIRSENLAVAISAALTLGVGAATCVQLAVLPRLARAMKDKKDKRLAARAANRNKAKDTRQRYEIIREEVQKIRLSNASHTMSRAMHLAARKLTARLGKGYAFPTVRRAMAGK